MLDISVRRTALVESLTGVAEGRPEAEAIAREYAREQQAAGKQAAATGRA